MQILYPTAVKAKRAHLLTGAAVMAVHNTSLVYCPNCGEGNLYRDLPCHGCNEPLPLRKAS